MMERYYSKILTSLPVEILYSIHLWALNPAFPLSSKYLYKVFKNAPYSISATYLFYRHSNVLSLDLAGILSKALEYPICTLEVFQRLLHIIPPAYRHLYPNPRQTINAPIVKETPPRTFKLSRRLFRDIKSEPNATRSSTESASLLTFLEYLYDLPPVQYRDTKQTQAIKPDSNSHDGYPLIKAVQAKNVPLIQLLLSHKADPRRRGNTAILLAIQHSALSLTKLLIEAPRMSARRERRKRNLDRDRGPDVDSNMLAVAVNAKAIDIVEWLVKEKGCIPDIKILRSMQ